MAEVESNILHSRAMENPPTPDDLEHEANGLAGSEDDQDLFGDDDEIPQNDTIQHRKLDDSELDSGDDEGRIDRLAETVEDDHLIEDVDQAQREVVICNVDFPPVRAPEGDEMYLLNMPPFLGLSHKNFHEPTYELPKRSHDNLDLESNLEAKAKFSPFNTATSTIFWRRDPADHDLIQSNSRIVRWSDGSLTLQLASKPSEHYRISTSALRQSYSSKTNKLSYNPPDHYDPNKDTHNYLAVPHGEPGFVLQTVRPFDAAMKIQATGDLADESVLKLQASLLANAKTHDPLASLKIVTKDPEREKLEAEKAEKDILRTMRKQENARERNEARRQGALGRAGLGRSTGLTVGGLEDDEGMPSARASKAKSRRRKTNRRGEIYSDDEDDTLPRGRTREDEYDREDDFLASSDEEPEVYDDGDDEEDILDDEDAEGEVDDEVDQGRLVRKPERREDTPKRPAEAEEVDEGQPVGGVMGSPQARKKRRVIDDEDDE